MAFASGTKLGPYEVVAQIGEGGMGQVYRATDTNLKLFDLHLPDISRSQWVVSKDGQRFIVETVREDSTPPSLNLIANWPELVRLP